MIRIGDVRAVLQKERANSFDACLTDPPYGLGFMGKAWDHGVPGPEVWRDVYRVLKPGAFMLAFGGTRTFHRLTCAIEDAGFEIRDCVMWLYGSGFPKSLDIGKSIDKRAGAREVIGQVVRLGDKKAYSNTKMNGGNYISGDFRKPIVPPIPITAPATDDARTFDGYGTALKPAWEPIIVAMKPLDGTFANNALTHGVAGLNIDAGRIEHDGANLGGGRRSSVSEGWDRPWKHDPLAVAAAVVRGKASQEKSESLGRWPANLILDKIAAAELDAQSGILTTGNFPTKRSSDKHRAVYAGWKSEQTGLVGRGTNSGGASRFFYVAKASKKERGEGNTHPTVKPVKLAQYLATLLLPPYQGKQRRLLVPFSGSGSELLGAKKAGWEYALGIDSNPEYVGIAEKRLKAIAA